MGLSATQGRMLKLTSMKSLLEKRANSLNGNQPIAKSPTKPERTSAEIKKEPNEIKRKLNSTPKEYKTWTEEQISYSGMLKEEYTTSSNGKFIKADLTLNQSGLGKIDPELLKGLKIEKMRNII